MTIWSHRRNDVDADHAEAIVANRPAWKQALRDRLDSIRETYRLELEAAVDAEDDAWESSK